MGSTQHLAALLFESVADIEYTVVPFNSSPESMGAVARGEVDAAFEIIAGARNAIENDQVNLIATTMDHRSAIYPDTPTVEESGVEPYTVSSWNSYVAPKGIPDEVVTKLNTEIQRILQTSEVKEKLLSYGVEPFVGGAEDMRARQQADVERWREVIGNSDIPIQN